MRKETAEVIVGLFLLLCAILMSIGIAFAIWYYYPDSWGYMSSPKLVAEPMEIFNREFKKCTAWEVYTVDQCTVYASEQAR